MYWKRACIALNVCIYVRWPRIREVLSRIEQNRAPRELPANALVYIHGCRRRRVQGPRRFARIAGATTRRGKSARRETSRGYRERERYDRFIAAKAGAVVKSETRARARNRVASTRESEAGAFISHQPRSRNQARAIKRDPRGGSGELPFRELLELTQHLLQRNVMKIRVACYLDVHQERGAFVPRRRGIKG